MISKRARMPSYLCPTKIQRDGQKQPALEIRLQKHPACLSAKIGSERGRARELSSATEMEWTYVFFFFFFSLEHLVQLMLLPCCAAWLLNAESQCEYAESSVLFSVCFLLGWLQDSGTHASAWAARFRVPAVKEAFPVDRRPILFFLLFMLAVEKQPNELCDALKLVQ